MLKLNLKTQKSIVRTTVRELVTAMGEDARREASERIQSLLWQLAEKGGFGRIFCYYGVKHEVATLCFMQSCLEDGRELYLPRCESGRPLEFYRVFSLEGLTPDIFGIPSPVVDRLPELPREGDLVVVPGAAFCSDGCRLGRGGGYYDRFLKDSPALHAGLCFGCALFDSIPHDMYDISVRLVITEMGVKETDVG